MLYEFSHDLQGPPLYLSNLFIQASCHLTRAGEGHAPNIFRRWGYKGVGKKSQNSEKRAPQSSYERIVQHSHTPAGFGILSSKDSSSPFKAVLCEKPR